MNCNLALLLPALHLLASCASWTWLCLRSLDSVALFMWVTFQKMFSSAGTPKSFLAHQRSIQSSGNGLLNAWDWSNSKPGVTSVGVWSSRKRLAME